MNALIFPIKAPVFCHCLLFEEFIKPIHSCFLRAIESSCLYFNHQCTIIYKTMHYLLHDCLKSLANRVSSIFQKTIIEKPPKREPQSDSSLVFWREKLKQYPQFYQSAPEVLKEDIDLIHELIQKMGVCFLTWCPKNIKKNKELALSIVKMNGMALQYFDVTIKDDSNIVREAIRNDGRAFQFASERLKSNRTIAIEAVRFDPKNFLEIPYTLIEQDQELLALYQKDQESFLLSHADPLLQDNLDFVKGIVSVNGTQLQFASERLKEIKTLVIEAINADANAFEFASIKLRDDPFIAGLALEKNGLLLKCASKRLQNELDTVRRAVTNNPQALIFADRSFREESSLVEQMIRCNPLSLEFMNSAVRSNKSVIELAISLNKKAFQFANPIFFQDHAFLWEHFTYDLKASEELIDCGFSVDEIQDFRRFAHKKILVDDSTIPELLPFSDLKMQFLEIIGKFANLPFGDYFSTILLDLAESKNDPFPKIQEKIVEAKWTEKQIPNGLLLLFLFLHLRIDESAKERLISQLLARADIFLLNEVVMQLKNLFFYFKFFSVDQEIIQNLLLSCFNEEDQDVPYYVALLNAIFRFFPHKVERFTSFELTEENLAQVIMEDFFSSKRLPEKIEENRTALNFSKFFLEFKYPDLLLAFLEKSLQSNLKGECSLLFFHSLFGNVFIKTRRSLTSHQDYLTKEQLENWFTELEQEKISNQIVEQPIDLTIFTKNLLEQNYGFGLLDRLIFTLKGGESSEPFTELEEKLYRLIKSNETDETNLFENFLSIYEDMEGIDHPLKSYIGMVLDDFEDKEKDPYYTIYDSESIEDFLYVLERILPDENYYDACLGILLDGKYRLLIVKNDSGLIVNWTFTRIMMNDSTPVMYLELFEDQAEIFVNYALKKAKKMGVDLYVKGGEVQINSYGNVIGYEKIFLDEDFVDTNGVYEIFCSKIADE